MGGDRRSLLTGVRDWILERIEAEPDLTIEELRNELREHGVIVGYGTVWRFFEREAITFKKSLRARSATRGSVVCASAVATAYGAAVSKTPAIRAVAAMVL
jgi:transposase